VQFLQPLHSDGQSIGGRSTLKSSKQAKISPRANRRQQKARAVVTVISHSDYYGSSLSLSLSFYGTTAEATQASWADETIFFFLFLLRY
jgi:hypothetical protein